jgi:microsomal epoxide hydrolase
MPWDRLPAEATLHPKPFRANVSDQELEDFKELLRLSKLGPKTFENLQSDEHFGISRDWLASAKDHWLHNHDWYAALHVSVYCR